MCSQVLRQESRGRQGAQLYGREHVQFHVGRVAGAGGHPFHADFDGSVSMAEYLYTCFSYSKTSHAALIRYHIQTGERCWGGRGVDAWVDQR